MTGLARELRRRSERAPVVAGFLLEKEMDFILGRLGEHAQHPYFAVLGGAKVSGKGGKMHVIRGLLATADRIFIGGAMLHPFLLARGFRAGEDPLKRESSSLGGDVEAAASLLSEAADRIVLPTDVVVSDGDSVSRPDLSRQPCPAGFVLQDVDPKAFVRLLRQSGSPRTLVWNGPLGRFEDPRFAGGTEALLRYMVRITEETGAITVAGGGDSEGAIRACMPEAADRLSHVSTGGGAMLAALAGAPLYGVNVLDDACRPVVGRDEVSRLLCKHQ